MKINRKFVIVLASGVIAAGSADAQTRQFAGVVTAYDGVKTAPVRTLNTATPIKQFTGSAVACDTVDFNQEAGWLNTDHTGTSSADCLTGNFSSNVGNSGGWFDDNGSGLNGAQSGDRVSCFKGWDESQSSGYNSNTFGGTNTAVWTWELGAGSGGFTTIGSIQAEIGVVDDGPTNYEWHIWTGDGTATGTSYEGIFGSGAFGVGAVNVDGPSSLYLGDMSSVDLYTQNLNFSTNLAAGEKVYVEMYAYGSTAPGAGNDNGVAGHGLGLGDVSVGVCHNCVPEPSSALLGLIAGAGFLVRRRR